LTSLEEVITMAAGAQASEAVSALRMGSAGFSSISQEVPSMKRVLCGLMVLGPLMGVTGQAKAEYLFTTIDVPISWGTPARDTAAFGINDTGEIVGTYVNALRSFTQFNGFQLNGSRYSMLPELAGDPVVHTWAYGINSSGQIIGYYQTKGPLIHPDGPFHGYLLSQGVYTTLDVPNSTSTQAFGINASGQIVGLYNSDRQHAFLRSGGAYGTLDVPGSNSTRASGINTLGQIVGGYMDARNKQHGYWLNAGSYATLDVPGSDSTSASGINDSGQIVGEFNDRYGFVLSGGTYSTIDVPGSVYTEADGINASGQIVGYYYDSFFNAHGFLATPAPVPEPSTLLLLTIGTVGLIGYHWGRRKLAAA